MLSHLTIWIVRYCAPVLLLATGSFCFAATKQSADDVDFGRCKVTRLPPGTIVGKENANGWNRLVLFAKPRLASGAVEKIPEIARDYATRFSVVIMARVRKVTHGQAEPKYELGGVGVGYCMRIHGQHVVISSESHEELGADLDTIERIVLGQNEKVLDDMVQIVRSRTITLFDVKALVLQGKKNRDVVVRHLVWVVPATGKVATLVWPLSEDPQGGYRVAGKSLALLNGGFREDRVIHVSADEITMGIPSARAFALARMPQGKPIPVDERLAKLAARQKYDQASMKQLLAAIREAF